MVHSNQSSLQKDIHTISRRQLLQLSAVGAGSLALFTFLPKASAQTTTSSLQTTIARNHGHSFAVKLDELLKAGPQVYNIKGSAFHRHDLEITEEILTTLQKTKVVEVESTTDMLHSHIVRIQIV